MISMEKRFESAEELMAYVEREAERRSGRLLASRDRSRSCDSDDAILAVLRDAKRPLTADLISTRAGIPASLCTQRLAELIQEGLVSEIIVCNTEFYAISAEVSRGFHVNGDSGPRDRAEPCQGD